MSTKPRFATRAARATPFPRSASRPLVPGLHLSNVYVFDDLEQVDDVWEGRAAGYVYGRFGTPNHTMLEDTLAALEGGEAGLAVASGMGALSAFLLGGLRSGDHVVAGQDLYGATTALLREQAARWGIRVTFVDASEAAAQIARTRPDLVIMDLRLGHEVDAVQILLAIKRPPSPTADIPVLICSASRDLVETHLELLERLGCEIVDKPFGIDDLLAAIDRCLAPVQETNGAH